MRLAVSKLENNLLRLHSLVGSKIKLASWALSYCTGQLRIPWEHTKRCACFGDRWARVFCGQIGWLSDPLRRVDADRCLGLSQPSVVYSCTHLKLQRGCQKRQRSVPPHREHTTNPTTAQRPRPPQDGARKTMAHTLAHTRPLP